MNLSITLLILIKHEERKKRWFDILATTMNLMEERCSSIDLTRHNNNMGRFVDLTNDQKVNPEFIDLFSSSKCCSVSSSTSAGILIAGLVLLLSTLTMSSTNFGLKLTNSKLMPCGLLQGVNKCTDSDNTFSRTDWRPGLPHPWLIGTLIQFCQETLWNWKFPPNFQILSSLASTCVTSLFIQNIWKFTRLGLSQ